MRKTKKTELARIREEIKSKLKSGEAYVIEEVSIFGSKKPDGLSYRKMAPSDTYEQGKRRIENGKIYSMVEICR